MNNPVERYTNDFIVENFLRSTDKSDKDKMIVAMLWRIAKSLERLQKK